MEQTYSEIEYVFVNDCCQDHSMDILYETIKDYPQRTRSVVIVNHNSNMGLGASRNDGVTNASGEFIMHVDSDDYLEKDAIQKCLDLQRINNADIVSFDAIAHFSNYDAKQCRQYVDDMRLLIVDLLKRKSAVNIWGLLIRRSLYLQHNISVSEGVNNSEDYNVTPLLFYYAQAHCHLHEFLYHYECSNPSSYTYSFSADKAEQVWITLYKLEDFFKDKGYIYLDAINESMIRIACKNLIDSSKKIVHKEYYLKTFERFNDLDMTMLSRVPFPYRMAYYIRPYFLLRLYTACVVPINSYIKKKMNIAGW